jgi:hypothetical protein
MYSLVDIGAGVGQFGRWLLEKASTKHSYTRFPLESTQKLEEKIIIKEYQPFLLSLDVAPCTPLLK